MSRKRERDSQKGEKQAEGKFKVKERILLIDSSLEGSRVPGPSWAKLGTQRSVLSGLLGDNGADPLGLK